MTEKIKKFVNTSIKIFIHNKFCKYLKIQLMSKTPMWKYIKMEVEKI